VTCPVPDLGKRGEYLVQVRFGADGLSSAQANVTFEALSSASRLQLMIYAALISICPSSLVVLLLGTITALVQSSVCS